MTGYDELLAQGQNLRAARTALSTAFASECEQAVNIAKQEAEEHPDSAEEFDSKYEEKLFLEEFQRNFPLNYKEIADPPTEADEKLGWKQVESAANSLTQLWLNIRQLEEEAYSPGVKNSLKILNWSIESARTTSLAISLLVREGFLADAQARWRGLYEQSCQLAILANSTESSIIQACYDFADSPDIGNAPAGKDYAWARPILFPNLPDKKVSQRDIFEKANLTIPAERQLLRHEAVHMSNLAIKRGGTPEGTSRSGSNLEGLQEISTAALVTLVDLVANSSLFVSKLGVDYMGVLVYSHDYYLKISDFVLEIGDVANEFLDKCRIAADGVTAG